MNELNVKFNYDYPFKLNLQPGSELHDSLVDMVIKKAVESRRRLEPRFSTWKEIDRTLTAYVPLDEKETQLKQRDSRTPVSIVVPISYAALEILLTYLVAAFLESPIFKYDFGGPEDVIGVALLERHVDRQVRKMKVALKLHTMWRDSAAYGIGPVVAMWKRKMGWKSTKEDRMEEVLGQSVNFGPTMAVSRKTLFEGNDLINIDPYKLLIDPNISPENIQDSEFFGWLDRTNLMRLLSDEQDDADNVFNIKYLKESTFGNSRFWTEETGRYERLGDSPYGQSTSEFRPIDTVSMYVNLIPKDYKLSGLEYPEKWFFRIAGDKILIEARPLGLNHDMYPVAIDAPTFDGHRVSPISILEVGYGMQETVDWLFKSHVANVRKAIHDMIVYDPSVINTFDLSKPGPGKYIRTRRAAWGQSVKDAIMQLGIVDITRTNINDVQFIFGMMREVYGINPPTTGSGRRGGERVTAAEINSDQFAAFSRLEKNAKLSAMQAMYDIGYLFAAHTIQFADGGGFLDVVGRYQEDLIAEYGDKVKHGKVPFEPSQLDVDFDVVPHDGTIPGNTDAQAWIQIFQALLQNPVLAQKFDIVKVFRHIARGLGAKNAQDFEVKVMPDGQVIQQAQAGNIVPAEQLSPEVPI